MYGRASGENSPSIQQPDRSRDRPLPAIGHRQTENGYRLYRVAESNWLLRPNNGGLPQRWREGRAPEPARCCGVRLPVRWRLSCQLLGRQCRPESGQKSPPTASPTSTTTSTAHRKRSEALPQGCSTDLACRPILRASIPASAGCHRRRASYAPGVSPAACCRPESPASPAGTASPLLRASSD